MVAEEIKVASFDDKLRSFFGTSSVYIRVHFDAKDSFFLFTKVVQNVTSFAKVFPPELVPVGSFLAISHRAISTLMFDALPNIRLSFQ